jgi:lysophospholipase L1-like esterase/poly(3-hydroxybutyrate) depolymerase
MKHRSFCLLLAALAFPLSACAEEFAARRFTAADGASIGYRLLAPEKLEAGRKYPLVLFLHGAGERGDDNAAQMKHGVAAFASKDARERFPCFVLAPQCPKEQTWSAVKGWTGERSFEEQPTEPMRLVLGALDALLAELPIDRDRLYVTGLSMGGYGTFDLLARFPERWAAAAPICGGGDATRIAAAKQVPLWAFHGANDNVVQVTRTREMVEALVRAGGAPLYSEYPYVRHDSWNIAYGEPELLPWMFAQKRGQSAVPFSAIASPSSQPPSSACPGAGPMQSGLWFRQLWSEKRKAWAAAKQADQGAVVFFGDSITQGWGSLAEDFPKLKVANRGISGDTTRGLLTRVRGDVLDLHPRAVSILIGTNDLDQGAEPEVVLANLKALIAELRAADPALPIVINQVMPRGKRDGLYPDKIQKLNALYRETFAGDAKLRFCDTWTLFDDGSGTCKKEEFPDMLHPNAAGYAKWKTALQAVFHELGVAK